MKKIFTVAIMIFSVLAIVGCDESGNNSTPETMLTIRNQSSNTITSVKWNDFEFRNEDSVDPGLAANYRINPGSSKSGTVQAGTSYIYFAKVKNYDYRVRARTQEIITIETGEKIDFFFTDNTMVVNLDTNVVETLGSL